MLLVVFASAPSLTHFLIFFFLTSTSQRHPEFRRGHTPTSFLDNHIPEFNGVQLTNSEEEELAVAIAIISKSRESYNGQPTTTTHSNTKGDNDDNGGVAATVVVRLGGLFGSGDNAFSVTTYGRISSNNDKACVHRLLSRSSYDDDTDNNAFIDNNNNNNGENNGGGGSVFPSARKERNVVIDSLNLDLENYLAEVSLDGNNRTIQVRCTRARTYKI